MDPTSRDDPRLVDAVRTHTDLLLATARALDDAAAPSLCVGWSRGHVLSHLARNAEGMTALVRAAVDGTGETMYSSTEARDADIDAGSTRPLDELVADVEHRAAVLAEALPRLGAEHHGIRLERTPGVYLMRAARIPFLRLREVVYHHVDLDAGFTFADVEPWLVQLFLDDEDARLDDQARQRARAGDLLWRARGIRRES
ncbi:MAG TPA: maleylpyruvate isomerase family mycothiol-dependent enzyme [Ornithinibacter sp.]|nr:maleylpyruvate isomerase family mycothiol-dependent enzyme [Ornithinibacter sp.]